MHYLCDEKKAILSKLIKERYFNMIRENIFIIYRDFFGLSNFYFKLSFFGRH